MSLRSLGCSAGRFAFAPVAAPSQVLSQKIPARAPVVLGSSSSRTGAQQQAGLQQRARLGVALRASAEGVEEVSAEVVDESQFPLEPTEQVLDLWQQADAVCFDGGCWCGLQRRGPCPMRLCVLMQVPECQTLKKREPEVETLLTHLLLCHPLLPCPGSSSAQLHPPPAAVCACLQWTALSRRMHPWACSPSSWALRMRLRASWSR